MWRLQALMIGHHIIHRKKIIFLRISPLMVAGVSEFVLLLLPFASHYD